MAARKNYTAAQIINGLRRAEVGLANGKSMKEVIRDLGVSEQTYYRWRREYGGMKTSQAKRNLSTTMGHSTGLIREQCPVW